VEAVPRHGRPRRDARAQGPGPRGGVRILGVSRLSGAPASDGVYALADGAIFLAARLTPADDVAGPIVGGTRAFAGARGTFTSKARPREAGGDPSDETITLLA
jgi:hypothetical protein